MSYNDHFASYGYPSPTVRRLQHEALVADRAMGAPVKQARFVFIGKRCAASPFLLRQQPVVGM